MSTGPLKRDGQNGVIAYPKKIVTALANGVITLGDVVMVETDPTASPDPDVYGAAGFVVKSSDAVDSPLACGIAIEGATDGNPVQIQVAGFNATGTSTGAIALNAMAGSGAGGDISPWATESATAQPFAVCVNAFAGTTNDGAVLIIDKGWFG